MKSFTEKTIKITVFLREGDFGNGNNTVVYEGLPTEIDITKLTPGGYKFDIEIKLPYKIKGGKYSLLAGITDGKTQVLFATDAPRVDGFTLLAENIEVFG